MTYPYATFEEFTMAYSFSGITEAAINSYWLFYGSQRVNSALNKLYTTPFSSNNWTAKDLTIQYAALGILVKTLDPEDGLELERTIKRQINNITSGGGSMVDITGSPILPDLADPRRQTWSSTMDYKNVFDMREPEEQRIDPDLLRDQWNDDNY
jgi:hypothetical protein